MCTNGNDQPAFKENKIRNKICRKILETRSRSSCLSFLSIRCFEHVLLPSIHLPISFEVYFRNYRNSKCVCVCLDGTTSTFNWRCARARAIKHTWTNVGYVGIFVFLIVKQPSIRFHVRCSNRSSCNRRRCCVAQRPDHFVCSGMPPFIGLLTRCRRYSKGVNGYCVLAAHLCIYTFRCKK